MGKAQFEIVNIVLAYLGFLLFLIIFIILFGVAKGCSMAKMEGTNKLEIISKVTLEPEANLQILNFLKTPVKFEDKDLAMADLIALWAKNDYDKKYETPIITEGYKIFDRIYGKNCFYMFISTDLNPAFVVGVSPATLEYPERFAFGDGSTLGVAGHTAPSAYIPFIDKDGSQKLVMVSLDLTGYAALKSYGYSDAKIREECNK